MLKLDIGCSKNIIIYFLKKERVQQPGPASSEVECPLFNPGFQVWFLHQRADGTSFAQWQKKSMTSTFQINLANRMPSTGTTRKQILHSLSEQKEWLFPQQRGPTDGTDDVITPTLQQQL